MKILHMDKQINDFFAACDENNDGVITWNEFILGASQLYKPPKPKTDKKILGAAPAKVLVTCDIATSPLTIEIHSGMTWVEVQALTVSAFEVCLKSLLTEIPSCFGAERATMQTKIERAVFSGCFRQTNPRIGHDNAVDFF